MKRILNYPGSKWSMADFIIDQIPEHVTYLEPFFGSGAVLFNKPISKIETINDLDSRVYNFFTVCREQPEELVKAVYLTPMSREEQAISNEPIQDPLENARRFLVQSWQSIGGIQLYKTGWRNNIDVLGTKIIREWAELPETILEVADRLKKVQIENQDALKMLTRYNREKVFAYIDPPYLLETRTSRYYETELQNEDHVKMLEILKNYKGKFVLSGYDHPMYDNALPNCYKVYHQANAEAGQSRTEVLWMNYEPTGQLSLL